MIEEWKQVAGYEGQYMVSNKGRVKSLERTRVGKCGCIYQVKERILKQYKDNRQYLYVDLCKNAKTKRYKVHRLVAETFLPNKEGLPCVNHKDETRTNNCIDNLEWCSFKYNSNYGTAIKRRVEKVTKKIICVETETVYPSASEIQRKLGFNQSHICRCCNGKIKTSHGYHWKYVNNNLDFLLF